MPDRVCLATLVRPRGLKGELVAEAGGDWSPAQLLEFAGTFLHPSGRPVRLSQAWEHHGKPAGRIVLKLEGVDTIEQAEPLRGQELSIPGGERPAVPEGEFYIGDLAGCRVIHCLSGLEIGTVAGCLHYGGPMLLRVSTGSGEVLIPFVNAICREIDVQAKRILVDPPEGLLEL